MRGRSLDWNGGLLTTTAGSSARWTRLNTSSNCGLQSMKRVFMDRLSLDYLCHPAGRRTPVRAATGGSASSWLANDVVEGRIGIGAVNGHFSVFELPV